jgi:hypothetical protein
MHPRVTKVVALNAGAPPMSPVFASAGPARATAYHVVGDIISTHVEPPAADIVRVRFGNGYINWLNPWYHSTDRFFRGAEQWKYASAQEEQDLLEDFFLFKGRLLVHALSLATSIISLPFFGALRDAICDRPIAGAKTKTMCKIEKGPVSILRKVLRGIGGFIIGGVLGGPVGAVAGVSAGFAYGEGDLRKALEQGVPGFKELSTGLQHVMIKIYEEAVRSDDDPYSTVEELAQMYFDQIEM